MFHVTALPIHQDNYIWLIRAGGECWVVDPGLSAPVLDYISRCGISLKGILVTHKHWDHITGIQPLIDALPAPVYGPRDPAIPVIDQIVKGGDLLHLGGFECKVMDMPGHTREHLGFHFPEVHALFSGDTLFSAGCGRIFDGSHETLFDSLSRISALPPATRIYGAHEYTLQNIDFALFIEPDNPDLITYKNWCVHRRQRHLPTLPTTAGWEVRVNPFLRTGFARVRQRVAEICGIAELDEFQTFRELRLLKNRY